MKAIAAQLEADIAVLADPYSGFVKVIHDIKLAIRSCNATPAHVERIVKAETGSPRSRRYGLVAVEAVPEYQTPMCPGLISAALTIRALFMRVASSAGGRPKKRLNSRLNCEGLS